MKRNWNQIDKIAMIAMQFVIDYCDMKDLCADCPFHNEDLSCCMVKVANFNDLDKFIEEAKRND